MKRMNNLMMGMLAIAAATFTGCSNEEAFDHAGTGKSVDNFYMKLQVTGTNTPNGTRTTGDTKEDGTSDESTIKSGTIWLVDANGNVAFSKHITAADWDNANNKTSKPIKVAVTQVSENTPYKVYFLANKEGTLTTSPTTQGFTSANGGADHATAGNFVMFNQNDKLVKAAQYTVTFTAANKNETSPAKPTSAIKLDRATARIDYPTSTDTIIKPVTPTDTKTYNIEAIKKVDLLSYAPFNLANKENMEQKWDANWEIVQLPNDLGNLYQLKTAFGDGYHIGISGNTNPPVFTTEKSYIFENVNDDADKATGIFLKYRATAETTANKDFADGTFYRYDKRVFTSIEDIIKYADAANPFGKKTAAEVVAEIKGDPTTADPTKFNLTTDEDKIETFRKAYNIEVFEQGYVYYQYLIEDANHTGKKYSVLRNSIYRLNITAIYELGSDTPNTPPIYPNYYLNVEVTVNPWVLVAKDIELK